MKHIKKYNLFKESISNDYSIYDFFNLINYNYGDYDGKVSQSKVKVESDKFIGEGIYDKVKLMVDDIVEKFEGINLNEIESRFTDFSDHYDKECHIFFSILGSNFKKYFEDVDERYNSSRGFNANKIDKESLIIDIMSDIIRPTLTTTLSGDQKIRQTNDQIYVTDPKWNCVNFNIDDYESQNDLDPDNNAEEEVIANQGFVYLLPNPTTRRHSFLMVNQRQGKKDLKKYSVDKFFDKMYVPALNIKIGDYSDGMTMNLLEVEKRLDAVVDDILFDIPHSDIIWDSARFKRRFDPNINIYQYNIKVILK